MLVQTARSSYWKKWAAKHEYEELKGAGLEPGLALLRKKVRDNWTEKHHNVAKKIFLVGGRIPVNVKLARKRKEQKSTGCTTAQNGTKSGIQEGGTKSKNIKEGMEVAKRYCCASSQ